MIAKKSLWFAILTVFFAAGAAMADEGVVARIDVCRKGTLIIRTSANLYLAAYQATMAHEDHNPWSHNKNPPCTFPVGERLSGDLNRVGTVTLTNSSGRQCDFVIEGTGDTVPDAEQILGCE